MNRFTYLRETCGSNFFHRFLRAPVFSSDVKYDCVYKLKCMREHRIGSLPGMLASSLNCLMRWLRILKALCIIMGMSLGKELKIGDAESAAVFVDVRLLGLLPACT
jgi:hypothetical protein